MDISIIGAGYVGLCSAAGLALKGNKVICADVDPKKIEKINTGEPPIEEPGLKEALDSTRDKLTATTDINDAVLRSSVTFICVGTPSTDDGSIDLSFVKAASEAVGKALRGRGYHLVVVKSTVVPGTTEDTVLPIIEKSSEKRAGAGFGLCTNPEFLREGSALEDFLNPDRIVIGEFDRKAGDALAKLYQNFNSPVVRTGLKTAEMIKYASNAFLASKISLINEIGNICKSLGVDAYTVAEGVGYDKRIGRAFLNAGVGFGGSCFSKDVLALTHKAKETGNTTPILDEVIKANKEQRKRIIELLKKKITLKSRRISILGLAFKEGTGDVRDSPAVDIVRYLLLEGASVVAYDPKATDNFRKIFPDINYAETARQAIDRSDACLVLTSWDEFRSMQDADFEGMKSKIIIEGRHVLDTNRVTGFEGICW